MSAKSKVMPVGEWMRRVRYGVSASLAVILLLALPSTTARAVGSIAVGDGTPQSCTQEAVKQAIVDVDAGGLITFNCGSAPVTIFVYDGDSSKELAISKDLTMDGGGLVTFSGFDLFFIISGTVQFVNLSFADAQGDTAGAIENHGTLTLDHVTLARNGAGHASGGGGIINDGTLTIEDSSIVGNHTGCNVFDPYDCGKGGGILNRGVLHAINTAISNNGAAGGGGGIYNQGTATLESSTISGNSAGCAFDSSIDPNRYCSAGGGIWNLGTLRLINSTVSGNSAGNPAENSIGGSGGGIDNAGTLFLQNVTIASNTGPSGGGLSNSNSAVIQNSILAGNSNVNGQASDCTGTLTSQGYNLIGNTAGCAIAGGTTGNLAGIAPLLGPLQDNGGPTLTRALLPGSPAIDAGNPAAPGSGGAACEATDQRGVARPQDGNGDGVARCDIGAVEVPPGVLIVKIDIKPGDSTNSINLKSQGVIPVAILSTAAFNAATVKAASVQFGPSGAKSVSSSLADVNGDGRLDLVLHFRTQQTGLQPGNTQACLVGQTRSGTPIRGCDKIRVVAASIPRGLVLWNKLGSEDEVLNSAFGPDLGFYQPGDCQNPGCLSELG